MCKAGSLLVLALLLALCFSFSLPAQSSDSSPILPEELPTELRQTSKRLDEYASELSDFSEWNERRIDALLKLSAEQQEELERLSGELPKLRSGLARAYAELNKSERDSRNSEQAKTRAIAQLQELEQKLNDSEKSLQRLKVQMWIERIVIGVAAFGAGYGAAEAVDRFGQ